MHHRAMNRPESIVELIIIAMQNSQENRETKEKDIK